MSGEMSDISTTWHQRMMAIAKVTDASCARRTHVKRALRAQGLERPLPCRATFVMSSDVAPLATGFKQAGDHCNWNGCTGLCNSYLVSTSVKKSLTPLCEGAWRSSFC